LREIDEHALRYVPGQVGVAADLPPGGGVDDIDVSLHQLGESRFALAFAIPSQQFRVSDHLLQCSTRPKPKANNYPRLAAIKNKYDPAGLFFVHHGVGSEQWSADGFYPPVRLTATLSNIDDCIGFDLDQPLGVNKARDLHDRIDRANVAKEFAMHRRDRLQSSIRVSRIRVRTTCPIEAPAPSSAAAIISRQRRACAAASPRPTVRPSGPSGAVPATVMMGPTRTAREMPTLGS
jgi:hypothetical protein